jgi:hypothetical protein
MSSEDRTADPRPYRIRSEISKGRLSRRARPGPPSMRHRSGRLDPTDRAPRSIHVVVADADRLLSAEDGRAEVRLVGGHDGS